MEASVYVHVPFCANGKCDYCDFYSVPLKPGDSRSGRFADVLLLEGERFFETFRPDRVPTVFIGGGTPSVLGAGGIRKLLRGLSDLIARYSSSPPGEITIEANPESADESFLGAIREGGVTRLSLGIQTFYGPSRRGVNRLGDESLLHPRLALAAEYFPGAFSVDLISGLPFQNNDVLKSDIAGVLHYKPVHVSLYALTVKDDSPLAAPDQDEADQLWINGRDTLEKSGYSQYEVSNFCLDGKESLHNVRYWRMYNWFALGPAGSGTIINDTTGRGFRYTIPQDVDAWLGAGGCGFSRKLGPRTEELDRITVIKESILMGFRYINGPDEDLFRRRFHVGIDELIPKTINAWRDRAFMQKDKLALTREGLLFLDRFLLDAFQDLDAVITS